MNAKQLPSVNGTLGQTSLALCLPMPNHSHFPFLIHLHLGFSLPISFEVCYFICLFFPLWAKCISTDSTGKGLLIANVITICDFTYDYLYFHETVIAMLPQLLMCSQQISSNVLWYCTIRKIRNNALQCGNQLCGFNYNFQSGIMKLRFNLKHEMLS